MNHLLGLSCDTEARGLLLRLSDLARWRPRWPNSQVQVPWGDGLVNRSIATQYYRCSWEDVFDDELVFINPWLFRSLERPHDEPSGPAPFLDRSLAARVYLFVERQVPASATDEIHGRSAVLDSLAASGVITTVTVSDAWRDGQAISGQFYGPAELSQVRNRYSRAAASDHQLRRLLLFELSVLSVLDRLHADAMGQPADSRHVTPPDSTAADALVASIYACFNAAYVRPELTYMHELLTVGAWIGHLVRGRSALLPPSIALPLTDFLIRALEPDASTSSPLEKIIASHASAAGGTKRLLRQAHRVCRTREPKVIRGRGPCFFREPDVFLWNEELAERFANCDIVIRCLV